jgi:hypothetical protein
LQTIENPLEERLYRYWLFDSHLIIFIQPHHRRSLKQATMARSKKPGWINWRSAPARTIILEDLLPGRPLFEKDNVSAQDLLVWYQERYPDQFGAVVLDQFEVRLKDHRKASLKDYARAQEEEKYLAHDRQFYPRKTHNERGEPVFNLSPAKLLLREDIKDRLHMTIYKTARKMWASRSEYKIFKIEIFKDRFLQEIRRSKYIHYLNLKRAKLRAPPARKEPAEKKAKEGGTQKEKAPPKKKTAPKKKTSPKKKTVPRKKTAPKKKSPPESK